MSGIRPSIVTSGICPSIVTVTTGRNNQSVARIEHVVAVDLAHHDPLALHNQSAAFRQLARVAVDVKVPIRAARPCNLDNRAVFTDDVLAIGHVPGFFVVLAKERRNVEIVVLVAARATVSLGSLDVGKDIGDLELVVIG